MGASQPQCDQRLREESRKEEAAALSKLTPEQQMDYRVAKEQWAASMNARLCKHMPDPTETRFQFTAGARFTENGVHSVYFK